MLSSNQSPSIRATSNIAYERDLVLSLVPTDEELSVHVPVNHCQCDKKPFHWSDTYSQH